jgi:hypothetical protein
VRLALNRDEHIVRLLLGSGTSCQERGGFIDFMPTIAIAGAARTGLYCLANNLVLTAEDGVGSGTRGYTGRRAAVAGIDLEFCVLQVTVALDDQTGDDKDIALDSVSVL